MPTTSPDNIFYEDGATGYSDATNASMQATSIQSALNFRQQYNFVWANAAARTAQTGMVQSSTGYQLDTKTPYIYDNSAWRLQIQYAEYVQASQTLANNSQVGPTTLTINSGTSTDTTFTSAASGSVTFVNPGIYAISWNVNASAATGTNGYCGIYATSAHLPADIISLNGFTQGSTTVVVPFYRITAANTTLWFFMYQNSGSSLATTGTIRIGRLS